MRKYTMLASIIPILFIIESIGARLLGASDEIKTVLSVFIIGMAAGQVIGVKQYRALILEDDLPARDERYLKMLITFVAIIGIWLIIEIFKIW